MKKGREIIKMEASGAGVNFGEVGNIIKACVFTVEVSVFVVLFAVVSV